MRHLRKRYGRASRRAHDFYLGEADKERLTLYTKMGPFHSHAEAVAYYDGKPRSGSRHNVVTVEHVPVYGRSGVEYGLKYVVRNLAGAEIGGPW